MTEDRVLDEESAAVQKHLEITQGVIQRMAENSRSCKLWCVTLVAAILVLVARTGEPQHAMIALGPAVLFWVLDAYYLAFERRFIRTYNAFVDKVHQAQVVKPDLYTVFPSGSATREFFWALFKSFSVLPFYLVAVLTTILSWLLIFPMESDHVLKCT